jgi:hypothetical protein
MTSLIQVSAGAPPAHAQLDRLRGAARSGIWLETLGACALLLVAYALPSLLADRLLRLEWLFRAILLATFVFVLARQVQRRLLRPLRVALSDDEMALAVERRSPEVKQALISALQFDRELGFGAPGIESAAMKEQVVADVRRSIAAIPFANAIDRGRVRKFTAGLVAAVAFFVGWAVFDAHSLGLWAARNLALANVEWPRFTALALAGADGNALRVPQGDALTIRVDVQGPVPDQVFVDYRFRDGERGAEALSRTGDREFTWTIDAVLADATLSLQGGDALPLQVDVVVVERPRIEDLTLKVTYPSYMEREPQLVPPTEGELRLPKGAVLAIAGKSQKRLGEAFLLLGNDQKTPLTLAADGHSFAGDYTPPASGLLVVDVIDQDRLGAGAPPKLLLRVGDDKPPTLEFRLRGIGSSITMFARIPGALKVKDDFGLRSVGASYRALADQVSEKGQEPAPEVPFTAATATYRDELARSALRFETEAQVDLMQWNKALAEEAPENPIRAGMLFSLRFQAQDNFGPGAPHEGFGETMVFRVVTREKLTEELRRRQVEQREELKRIVAEQQEALSSLTETPSPTQAGDRRRQAEARFKALARQQQTLGQRVGLIGQSYQRIIWEYENNRVWSPNVARQTEAAIPQPLEAVAKDAFPATRRLVDAFATNGDEATRTSAAEGYKDILARLAAVLKNMEEAENLAALIEELRTVIKLENEAIRDVQDRVKAHEDDIFTRKPK